MTRQVYHHEKFWSNLLCRDRQKRVLLYYHFKREGCMEKLTNINKNDVLKMSNAESNMFTKECIRTALLSLMAIKIFEQITVTEIIKKAGVSRGGFYRNYQSKEEVLQEICEDLFKYMLNFVTEHKFYENPRQWYIDFFKNIAENQEGYRLLMNAKAPKNVVLKFDEERIF